MGRSNYRGGSSRRAPKDLGRRVKKKPCVMCREGVEWVDYKDVPVLRKYMSDRGKIRSRRVTGNCAQHQRDIARAIKVARELVLLPYTQRTVTERPGGRGGRGERGGSYRADRSGGERNTPAAEKARDRSAPTTEAPGAEAPGAEAPDAETPDAETPAVGETAQATSEVPAATEPDAPTAEAMVSPEGGDAGDAPPARERTDGEGGGTR